MSDLDKNEDMFIFYCGCMLGLLSRDDLKSQIQSKTDHSIPDFKEMISGIANEIIRSNEDD